MKQKNRLHKTTLASITLIFLLTFFLSAASAGTTQNNPSAGPYAYFTNSGNGTVSVIDTVTNDLTSMVKVGNHPWGVAVSSNGKKVYVTNVYSNDVSVIDTATNTVKATMNGFNEPWGVAVSPDGKTVYVANSASNKVSVINAEANTVASTVIVGNNPRGIAVTPDGKTVYITNQNSNTVSVIDAATNTVSATVPVGSQPWGITVSPDGKKVYVANYGSSAVSIIDAATNTVSATVPVGPNPVGIAITPDGTMGYVTNYGSNTISVIRTATNTFTTAVGVGNTPYGVAFTPDGKKAYIASMNSNNVSVIDTATSTVIATVNVGKSVAFGQFIVPPFVQPVLPVADFGRNDIIGLTHLSVQFIDLSKNTTAWNWDFGDGTNSTDQSPLHTYSIAGNYTVNLTVSNGNGTDSMTREINVENISSTGPYAYITNSDIGTVSVIDTVTNNLTSMVSVGRHPWGVAVSSDGKKVYVTNVYSNNVSVIDTTTNTVKATLNGFEEPWGVAVSPDGKTVYVANSASNKVSVIDAATNTVAAIAIVGNNPRGVAVTPDGTKVYVTNQNSNNVSVIDTTTNAVTATVDVGRQPWGITVSPDGKKLYVANYENSTVSTIDAATNTVSATVPVGPNPVEVAITPDGTGAYVTNYGSNTVSVIRTVTNTVIDTVSVGNQPYGVAFTPDGKKAYIANMNSNSVSVIDTATDTVIAIVNVRKPVAFGQFIVPPLVQPAVSVQPVFPVADFSTNVSNGFAPLSVQFTDNSENTTIWNWDFGDGANSTDRNPVHTYLSTGNFAVNLTVSNGNGTDSKFTTINVTKVPSGNNNLKSLNISNGALSPSFASGTTTYTDSVPYSVSNITVTPTAKNPNANIAVNGIAVTSGMESQPINLIVGKNTINIVVTAQNGVVKTYSIKVTRTATSNNLESLNISSGVLIPSFVSNTTTYTDSVPYSVSNITVTPIAKDANANIAVNGIAVTSGMESQPINLIIGKNTITIVVTAQNGVAKTYSIKVTRSATSNNLESLTISSGVLTPSFALNTTEYKDSVPYNVSNITVTPIAKDINANIAVNGIAVTSGMESQPINLIIGKNTIDIVVTDQNGVTKTYSINVTRTAASNNLGSLTISSGVLTPSFASGITKYTDSVPYNVSSISVTPIAMDTNANIAVNGIAVTSGLESQPINLTVGKNTIGIEVTAQSGATKTYSVNVTRTRL